MSQSTISLIILGVVIILFIIQKIPLGITAVLGSMAMALTGVIGVDQVFSAFSNDAAMLVLGMVVVGNTLADTGGADMVGRLILRIPGIRKNEKLFMIITMLIAALLSAFVSNTATVAIFLPLVSGVAMSSGGVITRKNNFMAVGIASVWGGTLTLVGSTPQIVAQGFLVEHEATEALSFFYLTRGAIPIIVVMLIYFVTIGYFLQKKKFNFDDHSTPTHESSVQIDKRKMITTGIIFFITIFAFVFEVASVGTIAILAALACIVCGCTTLKRASEKMDWTPILVLAGSLGISRGLDQSGALQMLAEGMLRLLGENVTPLFVFSAIFIFTYFFGNFISSTATAAIMVPIAITVAIQMGSNPTTFVIGVIFACALDVVTPISTPPMTMTLCGGYRFSDYNVVGGVLSILGVVVALITLPLLYGL